MRFTGEPESLAWRCNSPPLFGSTERLAGSGSNLGTLSFVSQQVAILVLLSAAAPAGIVSSEMGVRFSLTRKKIENAHVLSLSFYAASCR